MVTLGGSEGSGGHMGALFLRGKREDGAPLRCSRKRACEPAGSGEPSLDYPGEKRGRIFRKHRAGVLTFERRTASFRNTELGGTRYLLFYPAQSRRANHL